MSEPDFDYALPYPSQRQPVLARNVVATSQPLAAQAGLEMLRLGGNAIDAAVAAAMALTVLEPTSNGIGSDAFALLWVDGKLHGLNASGRSPANMTPEYFNGQNEIATHGWDPVTVPGAVSAWVELQQRFGSLPLETLAAPAISYARDGHLVSPITSHYWQRACKNYEPEIYPEWHRVFAPNGNAPNPGELFKSEYHANTLTEIAATSGESFYRGALAAQIADTAAKDGGLLTSADLAAHQAPWVEPISVDYQGYRLHEIPPNGQGLAALLMLGILRSFDLKNLGVDTIASLHLQIEAMKLAFADAHRYVSDPQHLDLAVEDLLTEDYLQNRAALIDTNHAQDFEHGTPKPGGTVYLTTADAAGNMISFIQSNYMGFGSGIVIPQTGIAMQNRGANFTLQAGHPNQVGPNKRPYHTIIPGFVTQCDSDGNEQAVMSFGVMGGFMQPQGHGQMVIRLADYGQNPQAALDAPRWRVDEGLNVVLEPGLDAAVYEGLRELGHHLTVADQRTVAHGRGQIIYRLPDGYLAASDLRSDGQAVGY